ncbi:MAG: class I SAM-dependent methyltransferase [Candidatus Nealsonbacteria bacterium]
MQKLVENIIEKRTEKIVDYFENFINQGEKVLDIGAGGGWIAKEIKKRKNVNITLLDITDFNRTSLKLVLYDGEKIPFPDNNFDISLLIFTLHHCSEPLKILEEAKRVTRQKLFVIEDIPTSWLNKVFLYIWDIITNLPSLVKPPGENIFFNFKTIPEWQKIFKDFQLKLISQKMFQSNKLIHHGLFVVRK